jgi:predicted transcriptional regulator
MSKAERLAQSWFHTFNEHRMLICFTAMFVLTSCSIYFNFRLGGLNSSPSDFTRFVMPAAYSFLDVALLVLAMCIFSGLIRSFVLKVVCHAWFLYLTALSLFACLSCILALDSDNASSGDAFKRTHLEQALVQANKAVDTWTYNLDHTEKHKSKFQSRLDDVTEQRDDYIKEISKLDDTTPSSQVVFEAGLAFMPAWVDDAEEFRLYARLSFGVAMVITPLLLTAILAHILGDGRKEPVQSIIKEDEQSLGKSVSDPWSEQSVQDLVANRETVHKKPVLTAVQSQIRVNRTESGLKKPKGATHKNRMKVRTAILNGEPINYTALKEKYGVGKSTISSVLQELSESGLVEKDGRSWSLAREAKG